MVGWIPAKVVGRVETAAKNQYLGRLYIFTLLVTDTLDDFR